MIEIQLSHALALYAALLGAIIVAIWFYTEVTVRHTRAFLGKQYLKRCSFCAYTYLDDSDSPVSQCPRCESYNTDPGHEAPAAARHAATDAPGVGRLDEHAGRNPSRRKRPKQRRRGPRKR